MIYFDNAATSFPKPPEVEESMIQALHSMGNAGRGAHAATLNAARILYDTREKLAELFHGENPSRFAFTSNTTEALNIAIRGLFSPRDHVITTECEHNSVLRPLYLMEKQGVEVTYLTADKSGRIDYEDFERSYRSNTRAVVITHASNLTGNVTDLGRVSEFTQKHGLLLVVDAAQTAGVLPIDVKQMNIDVLCFPGHKGLLGPQGTGGIYVREGLEIPSFQVGGSGVHSYAKDHPREMPTALEAGTLNGHGIAGLNGALSYLKRTGIQTIYEKEMQLATQFVEGIRHIENVTLYGDFDTGMRVATVALNIGEYDSASVSDWLWEDYGIAVRAGAHCAPLMHKALQTVDQGAVRFSFSHYNTEDEVEQAVEAIRTLAQ